MRRASSLELFILSCIDRGLETPYDLQRQAGLSLGATNPALKRLIKAGLLKRSTGKSTTRRPRHQYILTSDGKTLARNGWKEFLKDSGPSVDIDSVLRILDLATYYGSPKSSILALINRVIESRRNAAELLVVTQSHQTGASAWQYSHLRAEFEKTRCLAELDALAQIHARLRKKPSPKLEQALLIPEE
jgi:DNA-binding PadR family transcriptional regulator